MLIDCCLTIIQFLNKFVYRGWFLDKSSLSSQFISERSRVCQMSDLFHLLVVDFDKILF